MKIVVTGATGFIGKAVVIDLALKGHEITSVIRTSNSDTDLPGKTYQWDISKNSSHDLVAALKGADTVIHLAGEPVAKSRWTPQVKESIESSRVIGTKKLVEAIGSLPTHFRPKVLINASAIGFYGSRGDEILNEASSAGQGFLSDVVKAWEEEASKAETLGLRVVKIRIGIVLGIGGGALEQMQPVVLGSGKQWMSWIHLDDVVSFIHFAIENHSVSGVINLTAPNPETNTAFTKQYSKAIGVGLTLKAPQSVLKLTLGEMASIVLDSTHAIPKRALESGFKFRFEKLSDALKNLYPAPLERRFTAAQFVAKPIEEVFEYFSRAENLEKITPPWLNFHIVATSTEKMNSGTLIDYKLKIHGLPIKWQSRIEDWEPKKKFVDSQIKGPYEKWHHTHKFEQVAGGTLVYDDVVYRLPAGKIGSLVANGFVKKDIQKIFSYRRKVIAEVFKK